MTPTIEPAGSDPIPHAGSGAALSTANLSRLLNGTYATVVQAAPPTGVPTTDQAQIAARLTQASTTGGIVELQLGTYFMNDELVLPDGVVLRGKGKKATQLYWPTDLGSGKWALQQSPTAAFQDSAPAVRDLSLLGPLVQADGSLTLTPGVAGSVMDGWRVGRNVHGTDMVVKGFRFGLGIFGDHNTFVRVKSGGNHYNVAYLDGFLTKGNQAFIACELDGASWCSVGVQNTNTCDSSVFIGGHLGSAPYGIYKEPGTSTAGGMMSNCLLDGTSFEFIGNAAMLDESTGTGSGADSLANTTIINPGFGWGSTYRIIARARDYSIDIRNAAGSTIRQPQYPFASGDVAAIKLTNSATYSGLVIEGTALPVMDGNTQGTLFRGSDYTAEYWLAGAAVTLGKLIENSNLPNVKHYGTDTRRPLGIALQSQATTGKPVAVAVSGRVTAVMGSAGPTTGGVPLVPDPADLTTLIPASSVGSSGYIFGSSATTPGKHPIFAQSARNISAGASGTVVLGISHDRQFVQPGAVSALPTASSTYRGQVLRVEGGTGVADGSYICQKQADGSYAWGQFPSVSTVAVGPSPVRSGFWFGPSVGNLGNSQITNNRLYASPLNVERAMTLTDACIKINTAGDAASVVRLGIAPDNGSGAPGTLLAEFGTVAGDSTGVKTISSLSVALSAGRYWLLACPQGMATTAAFMSTLSGRVPGVGGTNADPATALAANYQDSVSGALPSSMTVGSATNTAPSMTVKLT